VPAIGVPLAVPECSRTFAVPFLFVRCSHVSVCVLCSLRLWGRNVCSASRWCQYQCQCLKNVEYTGVPVPVALGSEYQPAEAASDSETAGGQCQWVL
jgi:hypothetical protein